MKKYLLISLLLVLFISGCSDIIDYSIDVINTATSTSPDGVVNWIKSVKNDNGIYLAKLKNEKGNFDYYLYINNLNNINGLYKEYSSVNIGSVKSDGIKVSVQLKDGKQSNDMLFLIKTEKTPKYFMLNSQKVDIDSINSLSDN